MVEGEYRAVPPAEIAFVAKLLDDIAHDRLGGMEVWRRIHELRGAGHTGEEANAKLMEEFGDFLTWDI